MSIALVTLNEVHKIALGTVVGRADVGEILYGNPETPCKLVVLKSKVKILETCPENLLGCNCKESLMHSRDIIKVCVDADNKPYWILGEETRILSYNMVKVQDNALHSIPDVVELGVSGDVISTGLPKDVCPEIPTMKGTFSQEQEPEIIPETKINKKAKKNKVPVEEQFMGHAPVKDKKKANKVSRYATEKAKQRKIIAEVQPNPAALRLDRPQLSLNFTSVKTNAFSLLGLFRSEATKAGWTPEQIKEILDIASSSDYRNMVSTLKAV